MRGRVFVCLVCGFWGGCVGVGVLSNVFLVFAYPAARTSLVRAQWLEHTLAPA